MTSRSRKKLLRFLAKEIPGVLPFVGDIWKDAVDEFTESDVDKALERIENFQQRDRETQVATLLSVLSIGGDVSTIRHFVLSEERRQLAGRVLANVLHLDWGNSRFLYELQQSERAYPLNSNATKEFRDGYLHMLEKVANESNGVPFVFHHSAELIAFPEGYEEYAYAIRNPPLPKPTVPMLLANFTLEKTSDGQFYFAGGTRRPVPFLPTRSGSLAGRDKETLLPNSISEKPSAQFWGAYYWVRPTGLRTITVGIGILDPLETAEGCAVWWAWNEGSPIVGIRPFLDDTEKVRRMMFEATVQSYVEMMKKHSEGLRGGSPPM